MAASTTVPFISRTANPGVAYVTDTFDTTSTGSSARYYYPPVSSMGTAGTFKVLSTCAAKIQVSSSAPETLQNDASAGQWADLSTATTGVTGGAIVPFTIPIGTVAVRVNVTTGLAGNQVLIEMSTGNGLY